MMSLTQFGELFTVPYFFHKIVETDRLPFWAAILVLNVPRRRTLGFIAVWVGGKTVHRIVSRFDTRSQATMDDKRTWDCVKKPFQAIVP